MKTQLAKKPKNTLTRSKEILLRNLTPEKIISSKIEKIEDILFKTKFPSIAVVRTEHGHNFVEGLICAWLMWLNKHLNLSKPMQEDSIVLTAQMIIKDYYYFKFEDISLIFIGILRGQYGELYEHLNTPKILTFFESYAIKRSNLAEEMKITEHNNLINKIKNT